MSPSTATGILLGRETELSLLTGLVRDLARGTGNAVLIEGEPGMGKSTLVKALVDEASAPYALDVTPQAFWGTGDELGQELPLLPFLDALRVRQPGASARRQAIVAMLRGEAAADRGADVTTAIAEQLLALVTDECAQQPVILVVDDLQWADPASVTLWGRLARLAPEAPLLLTGISRPVPQREDLLKLRRAQNDAIRLGLNPLGEQAVADLVEALAGGKPDTSLLRLARSASGNPLYVTEIVAALERSGGLAVTESGTARLADGIAPSSLPRSLSAAITDRLGFVPGSVREMLRAAALLGVEFAVPDLAIVLGKSVTDLFPTVDEARTVGVLTESGSDLAFRHPLIRAALYDEMPVAMRAAWHRDAGRALAAAGAPVDRVARQLLRAVGKSASDTLPAGEPSRAGASDLSAPPLDDWMLEWLTKAADLLVGQAPAVAAELLIQAVANTPLGSAHYGWLASRLANALYRIGDRQAAEEIAIRALGLTADPDIQVDLHWTLAQCRTLAGLGQESLSTLDQALTAPGISPRQRPRLLVLAARTHWGLGELDKAEGVAADALAEASAAGDTWATGWALHVLTIVATARGQLSEAVPLYDRALAVTQADPVMADLRVLLSINKAAALGNLDRFQEALTVAGQAQRLADQVGTVIRRTQAHNVLGQCLFAMGRWDEALIEVSTVPGNLKAPAVACCDLGIAALIGFHRGETSAAQHHLDASSPHSERLGPRFVAALALAQSLAHEQAGSTPEALAMLAKWFDGRTEELGEVEDLVADAARLAIQAGEQATARVLAKQAATFAEGSQTP